MTMEEKIDKYLNEVLNDKELRGLAQLRPSEERHIKYERFFRKLSREIDLIKKEISKLESKL